MSAAVPIPVIQLLQVLTVALAAPGLMGVVAKVEARLQGRRGRACCSRITTWPSWRARKR